MKAVNKTNFKGMKKPLGILFQSWGLLTGSTLFLLGAIASPSFAQVILVEENFKPPTLNPVYADNWRLGRGNNTSDPPCLTAAPQVATPATSGDGFIPGCPTNTTDTGAVDADGKGPLRLTPRKQNPAGLVLYNPEIDSEQGLEITFDFYIYSERNPADTNRRAADGISLFLIDGRVTPTRPGAFLGALGSGQRNVNPVTPGIEGGYVGMGFDEWGNFSVGAPNGLVGGYLGAPLPNQVAIRAGGDSTQTGYGYLRGTRDADIPNLPGFLDFPNQTTRPVQQRTPKIIRTPDHQISVEIDFGGGFVEIIPPYNLAIAPDQPEIPPPFKFGFASSTEGEQSIHEIQNLRLTRLAPDLSIIKTPVDAEFEAGLNEYTLTVSNAPSAALPTNTITVTDTLPPGFAFLSAVGTNWTCAAVVQEVTCTYEGTAPNPGETLPQITLQVNVTAPPGTYTNTATVTTEGDTNLENNTDAVQTTVLGTPRVGVAKAAGTITNNGDGTYTVPYTLIVQNYGDVPITNIQVEENLTTTFGSSPFTVVSLTSNTLTVNPNFDGKDETNLLVGTDTWPVGASAATIQFQVTVTPGDNLGPYNNSATASARSPGGRVVTDTSTEGTNPDPNGNNDPNSYTTPTSVTFGEMPLIGVAKAAGTITNNGDGTYTVPYTLIVGNYGDVPLNTLQVTENLKNTFANIPYTLEPNSLTSPTLRVNPNFNGNTDTNLLEAGNPNNTLAVDTEATITFRVRITPGNNLGPFNNQVTASGVTPGGIGVNDLSTNGSDPLGNNNTGDPREINEVTSVTLRATPNLELEKRITRVNGTVVGQSENLPNWPNNFVRGLKDANNIQPEDEVEYTIYFLSAGTGPLENAVICDPLLDYQTFRTDTFNGQTPIEGTFGAEVGIALALNPPNLDLPTAYLRSANSASNRGRFYPSGTDTPLICQPNIRGAVVVEIGNLGVGDYGFIRFRVTID